MNKHLLILALMLITSTTYAQKRSIKSLQDYGKYIKLLKGNARSSAKTTGIYWRLSAYAEYRDMGGTLSISDSGRYIYSNARGSVFDFEYMEYDDYGVDGEFNMVNADTCYKYSDGGSGFGLEEKYTSTYNSSNLRTGFLDQTGAGLPNLYNELATYDVNGNLTVELYQDWNSGSSKWDDSYVSYYGYDGNNNLISDSSYDHDWGQPDVKGVFTYDVNGNLQTLTYDGWDGSGWMGSYAAQYQYDGSNRPIISINQNYNNGNWVDYSKDSMTYSGSNTIYTTRTYMTWDTMAKVWENSYKEERTFNSNNVPATQLISTWNTSNSQWVPSEEAEHTYNQNGDISETRVYAYVGGTKASSYYKKIIYYYEVYFNVGVTNTEKSKAVKVYPNPATSDIHIVLNGEADVQVSLINMTGQTVRTVQVAGKAHKASINIEGLTSGNYIIQANSAGQTIGVQQIAIQ